MSEKRSPDFVFLLKYRGKTRKVELFESIQWGIKFDRSVKYRLRANGRWHGGRKKMFFTRWEFRDILFASIKF